MFATSIVVCLCLGLRLLSLDNWDGTSGIDEQMKMIHLRAE